MVETSIDGIPRRPAARKWWAYNMNATHCRRGHEFNEENARTTSKGWRSCRACKRVTDAKYRERRKAKRRAV